MAGRVGIKAVAGTCAILAALIGPSASPRADSGVSDAVVFSGSTSALTCSASSLELPPPVNSLLNCPASGNSVPFVGGTGTYSFASSACELASGTAVADDEGPHLSGCALSSTGAYTNVVCGTGTLGGQADISTPTDADDTMTVDYNGTAVTGIVVATGTVVSPPQGDDFGNSAVGMFMMVPTGTSGDGGCTTQFSVSGGFTLAGA